MNKSKDDAKLGRFGEPAILILLSLVEGPKHGYGIMVDVEQHMGVKLGPGTLYGAIEKLVRFDMIRPCASEERTKPYEITSKGRAAVAEFIASWRTILEIGERRLA